MKTLMLLRHALGLPKRLRERELADVHAEDALIDEIITRYLQPEMNCLDVGAHYGSMLSAILRAAPKGQHAAVEAIPEKAKFLRAKFPEVTIHNLALSADSGSVEFFAPTLH